MQKISLFNKNIYPDYLDLHQSFHQLIRKELELREYKEVWCPPLSTSPCFETHVHPFKIFSCKDNKELNYYLHTSPEFVLKKYLLNYNQQNSTGLYNLNYVFRDDLPGQIHRRQFIMLEFYRFKTPVDELVQDLCELVSKLSASLAEKYECREIQSIQKISINDLFQEYLNFSILEFLNPQDLYQKISRDFPQVASTQLLPWDDLYHLLWLNFIEPKLQNFPAVLIENFPAPLGLLAKPDEKDKRIHKRFELFVGGNEIANGYSEELTFIKNQSAIKSHLKEKLAQYNYQLPLPNYFLDNLHHSPLVNCYGVAMGTERLLQTLLKAKSAFMDFE